MIHYDDTKYRSEEYEKYMHSKEWRKIKDIVLYFSAYTCQECGSKENIEVHHKTYERLGQEKLVDLEALCSSCHFKKDTERKNISQKTFGRVLYNKRFEGWARKVHGEMWYEDFDKNDLMEEFDEWIENY